MAYRKNKRFKLNKIIALFLLFNLLNQLFAPTIVYALTAGPTAPEATSFEPIDTTDMVNPLTGSFTYNMPLLEVPGPEGGYPISLSYHAGIQPNEEASWVGLGWNLNTGAIARNVNGYPDDWKKASGVTRSVWNGGSTETIGGGISIPCINSSINLGLSFSQDTYRGFGEAMDIGVSFDLFPNTSVGFGLNASTYGSSFGLNAGAGPLSVSLSTNFSSVSESIGLSDAGVSADISSQGNVSFSLGGGEITAVNNPSASKVSTKTSGFTTPGFLRLSYSYTRYWSNNPQPFNANGLLYNGYGVSPVPAINRNNNDDDNYELQDINTSIVDNSDPLAQLGGTYPNFDNYSVTAQGLGGNIRPYIFSSILYNENRLAKPDGYSVNDMFVNNLPVNGETHSQWQFRFINDFSNSYLQGHPYTNDSNIIQFFDFDSNPVYGNNDGDLGYDTYTNRLEGSSHIEYFTNDQIHDGTAAGRGFIDCDAAGFTRATSANPTINGITNPTIGSQIGGFMITNASGVTYHYALPVYSSDEVQRTENEGVANIPIGKTANKTISWQYTDLTKNEAYAYTWYLTAITGPDYVSRGSTSGVLDPSDWGYWVKFDYGKWTYNYRWRNPSEGENDDLASVGSTIYSTGVKEIYYLDAVETRTHTAIFEKEIRADGKMCTYQNESQSNAYNPQALYYPQYMNQGYIHPKAVLRLDNIYLFKNDQLPMSINALRQNSTTYDQTFSYPNSFENLHLGQNVIDINDANALLTQKCLRKIAFNYDYSLAPGCPNSYDPGGTQTYVQTPSTNPPSQLYGKLTLLSVDFQGKGGAPTTPPTQFVYDLDPTDPENQGTISITNLEVDNPNQDITPAQINIIGGLGATFSPGDIISFSVGSVKYFCTLLAATDGTGTNFKALFINGNPGSLYTGIAAVKTKNPPYNKDAFDYWGFFKSDFGMDKNLLTSFYPLNNGIYPYINIRTTTPVSARSTDVWCLRQIQSSIGAAVNIDYESNDYNKSVLSKNNSILILHSLGTQVAPNTFTYTVDALGEDITKELKIGDVIHAGFITTTSNNGNGNANVVNYYNTGQYATPTVITAINGPANTITFQCDPQMSANIGNGSLPLDANLPVSANYFYGGGIRVKDIIVDDLNNNIKKTSYNYGMPNDPNQPFSSSGVTTYEPLIFDNTNLLSLYLSYMNFGGDDPTNVIQTYRKALYANNSKILSIAQELPGPGVMYEYVSVAESSVTPDGKDIPIGGHILYQYEVFKAEMLGVYDYNDEGTAPCNYPGPYIGQNPGYATQNPGLQNLTIVTHQAKRDRAIKDYTSRIGNLKRVISYDNLGNKLSETINHYLYDVLDNTSFLNQVNNYENLLNPYNNIGVIKERYGNTRAQVTGIGGDYSLPTTVTSLDMLSNRETFPSIQTGSTQIDYQLGTSSTQTNLAFDYYSGAVTQTLTTDSYGNRFVQQVIPAYTISNAYQGVGLLQYPLMGLRTHDDDSGVDDGGVVQHKQMLSQIAAKYTFTVDANNNPIGVVSASLQTWDNTIPVVDQNGDPTTVGQSNVYRMGTSYQWMPPGGSVNNVSPYAPFLGSYTDLGSSDGFWKKTSQITEYNVYSSALEGADINNNYSATHMGYNSSRVIITGGPAKYNEIYFAGADDNLSYYIPSNINSDPANSHTGQYSVVIGPSQGAFGYSAPISTLTPQNYIVSVWVKGSATDVQKAILYYQNDGPVVEPALSYSKIAAGWYLLEMTVPASAITGSGNLSVGCGNASANQLYFDDFRFQPASAKTTAYVYDNVTGELSYVLDNNNLYTHYTYDAIGRLISVSKEVLGKSTIPVIKTISYNYGNFN